MGYLTTLTEALRQGVGVYVDRDHVDAFADQTSGGGSADPHSCASDNSRFLSQFGLL
jgi:hypothetical protein